MIPPELADIISEDVEILGGVACFTRTRIPVRILFDHINHGDALDEFLIDYPSVRREHALRVMAWEKKTALAALGQAP